MNTKKITALWATPRSRSTAFMWMMHQRGDFYVMQEPFGRAAYYSEERIFARAAEVSPKPEYNYQNVLHTLKQHAQEGPLFIKDFPLYFLHIVDENFLTTFTHTFLIRDPAQMLPSYYHKMPDLAFAECGYQELHGLFDKVVQHTGAIPPVINAEDLVLNPTEILQVYCAKLGLPFRPAALHWEPPGNADEIGWWDDRSWNDDLRRSKGFQETPQTYLQIHESPSLRALYEQCLPYYEELNRHRLQVKDVDA